MFRITIKGLAKTSYKDKELLHGIECPDEFTEFIWDDDGIPKEAMISGYMDFRYENGKLWTYTVYEAERELTKKELDALSDYTSGQWSDGIGEGFEQFPCKTIRGIEIYISPWFHGQRRYVTQEEIDN